MKLMLIYARSLMKSAYSNAIPENLMCYFDYVGFTRDLFMYDYFSVQADGQTHVFSNY